MICFIFYSEMDRAAFNIQQNYIYIKLHDWTGFDYKQKTYFTKYLGRHWNFPADKHCVFTRVIIVN